MGKSRDPLAPQSYALVPSRFGPLLLLWQETPDGPRVQRLLLPQGGQPTAEMYGILRANGSARSCPAIQGLGQRIARFLLGEAITFSLDVLALETCSGFQQRVLRAEHAIPRGWISTYGRLAKHLDVPGGARAVGAALAHNPFPLLIPCHRAIRSDGTLGGYQGGVAMKQKLLEMEGVEVSPVGKVLTDRIHY
jgi:methylated-DNA-[protein]-cysteine S-methyltransferase